MESVGNAGVNWKIKRKVTYVLTAPNLYHNRTQQ